MVAVQHFFDKATSTLTYVVWDPATRDCVVLDPVLDFDPITTQTSQESLSAVSSFIQKENLKLLWVLETHAHADHLSGSQILKTRFSGSRVAIGSRITEVQRIFKEELKLDPSFPTDGRQFEHLLRDGENFEAGCLKMKVIFTPGHTPACCSYLFEDALFTGDALSMPDTGVGRCDFPGASAEALFDSIQKLYLLDGSTHVFVGHDYQPGGRELKFQSTIGDEKSSNIHLNSSTKKEAFVKFRTDRDKTLKPPRLLLQSIRVNINAGNII